MNHISAYQENSLDEEEDIENEEVGLLDGNRQSNTRKFNPSCRRKYLEALTNKSFWFKLSVLVTILVLGLFLYSQVSVAQVANALSLFQQHPAATLPLFMLINASAVILFCPGAIFQMLAGVIFGFKVGLPVAWLGTNAGYCGAFLTGHTFLREGLTDYLIKKVPNFVAIETALCREGWRLLFLIRIAPILPDSIMNYVLSVMSFDFKVFALTSAAALLPYSVAYVYMGSLSTSIIDVLEHREDEAQGAHHFPFLTILPVLFGACAIAYITAVVKKAIHKVLSEVELQESGSLVGSGEEPAHFPLGDSKAVA